MDQRVESVRAFNRFYTKQIGVLNEKLVRSPYSLTEARVLYELANHDGITARELANELGIDAGYLSRIMKKLNELGFIEKRVNEKDKREVTLTLTAAGRKAFQPLDVAARAEVKKMMAKLPEPEQKKLVAAMATIREALGPEDRGEPYLLRQHRPGDMGWVVHRHGALYAEEYGWDERFEALVAGVVSQFIKQLDPERERCWIAERDGEIVGSIFCVAKNKTTAQLRLLLVEPSARGLGIGSRLVDEVIRFARQLGYRRLELWTQRELTSARRIYKAAGFEIVGTEGHEYFGVPLLAETWAMELR